MPSGLAYPGVWDWSRVGFCLVLLLADLNLPGTQSTQATTAIVLVLAAIHYAVQPLACAYKRPSSCF